MGSDPARNAWLRRVERAMRPLDHLPRGVAIGAGVLAGAAAGLALGWTGEPWTLGAGAAVMATAWWLVRSAEPVAVIRGVRGRVEPLPEPVAEVVTEIEDPAPAPIDPLRMIDLPGGRFWMGSAEGDKRAYSDEHPRHEVEVAPFSMMAYAVTQKLYREVTGQDPGEPKGDDLPVNNVSWFDAVNFCNLLSEHEGLMPAYRVEPTGVTWAPDADGYRLPTEPEWEYACRAGTETAYSFGDDEGALGEYAWFRENASDVQSVGRKRPNPFGLHDMHGNVWEWCWDLFGSYPYDGPTLTLPASGVRVLRGGSFFFVPRVLRSAFRDARGPVVRNGGIGFRCVRAAA